MRSFIARLSKLQMEKFMALGFIDQDTLILMLINDRYLPIPV
jgi:hypothetical protein